MGEVWFKPFFWAWEKYGQEKKLISWLKALADCPKHQPSLLMPTWHHLQVRLQSKTRILLYFPITRGGLQRAPFKNLWACWIFWTPFTGMLSGHQAVFLPLELLCSWCPDAKAEPETVSTPNSFYPQKFSITPARIMSLTIRSYVGSTQTLSTWSGPKCQPQSYCQHSLFAV